MEHDNDPLSMKDPTQLTQNFILNCPWKIGKLVKAVFTFF